MKKLKRIVLIDDDKNTNFYNEIMLTKANASEEIIAFQDARLALEYIEKGDGEIDVIFLDINMPIMNGWEFLKHYLKLEKLKKAKAIIVMLTSSINKDDEEKAKISEEVSKFIGKPLTHEVIEDILREI